jgi:hypothetical protein
MNWRNDAYSLEHMHKKWLLQFIYNENLRVKMLQRRNRDSINSDELIDVPFSSSLGNKKLTRYELYLEAADLNLELSKTYRLIALCMDKAVLNNGETLTNKELIIKSLMCDKTNSSSYISLGAIISGIDETIDLFEETLTEKDLYLKSIYYDSNNIDGYNNLACLMNKRELIKIPNCNSLFSIRDLYLESIHRSPHSAASYFNLALKIGPTEIVVLRNGRSLNKQMLYLEALHRDTTDAILYNNLAATITKEQNKIKLFSGEVVSERELYVRALTLEKENKDPWHNLLEVMDDKEQIEINNCIYICNKSDPSNKTLTILEDVEGSTHILRNILTTKLDDYNIRCMSHLFLH